MQQQPQDLYQAALDKLALAGFRGSVSRVIEIVGYPGGSYPHDYTVLSATRQNGETIRESYQTNLLMLHPEVTISEAVRIGLIDPALAKPAPIDAPPPPPLVDLSRELFPNSGLYHSTALGQHYPDGAKWTQGGRTWVKTKQPGVFGAFGPTEWWAVAA